MCSPKETSELLPAGLVSLKRCLLLRKTDFIPQETKKPPRHICTETSKNEESLPMKNMFVEKTNLLLKTQ